MKFLKHHKLGALFSHLSNMGSEFLLIGFDICGTALLNNADLEYS